MLNELLIELHKRPETVFSLTDISMMFPNIAYDNIKARMAYLVSKKAIIKIRKGIFAKENYSPWELANKLYAPSYISLETVLQKEGLVFQYAESIISVAYISRTLKVAGKNLVYRKIKDEILFNQKGVEKVGVTSVATKERAFLDAVFLYRNYHFDNLRPLNWEKVRELQEIYSSQALLKRVESYYQIYKEENVQSETA